MFAFEPYWFSCDIQTAKELVSNVPSADGFKLTMNEFGII